MSEKIPSRDTSPNPVKTHQPAFTGELYEKRKKIQPRFISGTFEHVRNIGAFVMLAAYFLLPWLTWDGRQAVLFDLPERRFYILGWTFWPQDFVLLSWLLIIAAFALFLVTVFAGRIWCGYTCPQTVWTKIFLMIERFSEGDRNARLRMDKAPLSASKLFRRSSKHIGWLLVSALTGIAFVGYFTPIHQLLGEIAHGTPGFWEVFWAGFFTFTTYLNAGFMREQVCMYMCPYGRFQSVMFDRDTLIVSYDSERGEPRGSRKRNANPKDAGLGDCIDCELCVQVCPTGIDIREGLQFQCIACAACIDACDSVMDQMGYARGLVKYTTENALEHGKVTHFLRPRLLGYSAFVGLMIALFIYTISTRIPMGLDVMRDRNSLYRENSVGWVENSYMLRVMNKSQAAAHYELTVSGLSKEARIEGKTHLSLTAGELQNVALTISADPGSLEKTNTPIVFHLNCVELPRNHVDTDSRFFAPANR